MSTSGGAGVPYSTSSLADEIYWRLSHVCGKILPHEMRNSPKLQAEFRSSASFTYLAWYITGFYSCSVIYDQDVSVHFGIFRDTPSMQGKLV